MLGPLYLWVIVRRGSRIGLCCIVRSDAKGIVR